MTAVAHDVFAALRRFQADLERVGVKISAVELDGDASHTALVAACIYTVGYAVDPASGGGAVRLAGVEFRVRPPWPPARST